MEKGDKLICKKEYFDLRLYNTIKFDNHSWSDNLINLWSNYKIRKKCILNKGKIYTVSDSYEYGSNRGYFKINIVYNGYRHFVFGGEGSTPSVDIIVYLNDYFYNKKETKNIMRKMKLNKISHGNR